jgi:hypothetical protein
MFAATVLVPVEGEPPPSAKQAMADARVAWRTATVEVRVAEQKHFFKIATFKMVEALAHCKASLQCFQKLILLDGNRTMINDVINKYTESTSADHLLLLMVMTSSHPETPGIENRLETMKQVMVGIYSTSKLLHELNAQGVPHFGTPTLADGRFLSRWKLHHYRAIFFSRLYAFRWAKKDSAEAHTLMLSCNESDPEVVTDFHTYAAYKKGKKYACAVCGELPVGNLLACSQCKVLSYCGPTCQKLHWKRGEHKQTCKFLMLIVRDA